MKSRKDWRGLMKILEIQHVRNGEVIWESKDLYNTLHIGGELFLLTCCFDNDGTLPPPNYYLGLDDRATITTDDLITDLSNEPVANGYLRAAVASTGAFTVDVLNGVYRATSQIVTFTATGSGWGPVKNLFLTTTADNSGVLLASSPLSNTITLTGGDAVNMRMALALQDCP